MNFDFYHAVKPDQRRPNSASTSLYSSKKLTQTSLQDIEGAQKFQNEEISKKVGLVPE